MRIKNYLILTALACILAPFAAFAQEQITVTTYYPSPYGIYRELRADQMAIGSAYRASALVDGRLIVSGSVGIGTINPAIFTLQVAGSVGPNADNNYDLGSLALKWRDVYCTRAAWNGSDRREKNNIIDTPLGLKFIMALRPVQFNWIKNDDGKHQGVIAQELEDVIKNQGIEFAGLRHDKKLDKYGVAYTEFIAPLIKAVQEQQKRIEGLELEVKSLKGKLNEKRAR